MAWTGTGTGTVGDPWQITTPTEFTYALNYNTATTYMKVMNDINMAGTTDYPASLSFDIKGHLEGNLKNIYGLRTGTTASGGFQFWSGAEIKNITFTYSSGTATASSVINTNANSLVAGTLQNIHVVATGTALLQSFSAYIDYGASFVISQITIEGNVRQGFKGNLAGSVDHIRLYRTTPALYYEQYMPCLFQSVNGTVLACQIIVPSYSAVGTDMTGGMIVSTIQSTTIIRQCLVLANMNITQTSPTTLKSLHVIYGSTNGLATGAIVEDCLVLGNYYLNGGEPASSGGYGGKSGFALGAGAFVIHRRNVFSGDLCNSYFNNRTPMSKAGLTVEQSGLFYNRTAITSMKPVDEAGKQVGLTSAQMTVQSNFTGYNFIAVWQMGASNPELINNPIYAYTLPLQSVSVSTVNRVSGSSFGISLGTFAVSNFGVDVLMGSTVVLNSENNLNPIFTELTGDNLYTIKPYYYVGAVKTYTGTTTSYQHYFNDIAVTVTTINETNKVTLNVPDSATLCHGSVYFDGYVYGTTRNAVFPVSDGYLVKAPKGNISAFQQIAIRVADTLQGSGSDRFSAHMEQVVICKGKLYCTFHNQSLGSNFIGDWVMQYDPALNDYKVFQFANLDAIVPIITDGNFLFFGGTFTNKVYKVDPDTAFVSAGKYNSNYNVPEGTGKSIASVAIAVYDENSQGGFLLHGYNNINKGWIHSATADSTYLYLAYTTPQTNFISGYDPYTGLSYCEIHKVRISDMTPQGWAYIPQCTDDMSQNADFLFLGVEVQPTAVPACLGYGWGALAVRKSDLSIFHLPRLHADDNPPVNQSYGSIVFGNYLIDLRTNFYIVVLDISHPETWSGSGNVGDKTLGVYINKFAGVQESVPINDLVSDTDGRLYGFYWSSPVMLSQFTLPVNIYSTPTLENFMAVVTESSITLSAHILNTGGKEITSKGIHYGTNPANLNNTVTSAESNNTFHAILNGLEGGTYFWKAFATNSEGTTLSLVQSFVATDTMAIYFNGKKYSRAYLGHIEIKF